MATGCSSSASHRCQHGPSSGSSISRTGVLFDGAVRIGVRIREVEMTTSSPSEQAEVCEQFYDRSIRYLVEIPDRFAIARWSRDADISTIARCILGTLKYEPHACDITALRRALESVVAAAPAQSRQEPTMARATNSPTTVPHVTVHATTGERTVIRLTPKGGWTAAEAQTFLAERKKEAERIDPETCEIGR